jgi:hypothetical protein
VDAADDPKKFRSVRFIGVGSLRCDPIAYPDDIIVDSKSSQPSAMFARLCFMILAAVLDAQKKQPQPKGAKAGAATGKATIGMPRFKNVAAPGGFLWQGLIAPSTI